MLKNIKGAIFDMDGTLIDSMWVWQRVDEEFLQKRNIEVPINLKDEIEKLSFDEVAIYFKTTFNLPDTVEEIQNEWFDMALHEYSNNVGLKPGAREFLYLLKSKNIKIALATSNSNPLIEIALKKNNIFDFFDAIVTTDEVDRGKDFPDVYILASNKLGVSPNNCIVFEDILPAVKGAKAAGMTVIGVHDTYSDYQKDSIKALADMYILKYDDLTSAV